MHVEPPARRMGIQDASAWILRVGVIASVLVMLAGLVLSFADHAVSVEEMRRTAFDGRLSSLWCGLGHGDGKAVIELGIYLLVLTPIVRVATSMVLFLIEEHDRLYAAITGLVLGLTLAGLLFLR